MEEKEITLEIDGKEVKAKEGMTILEVAKHAAINIPTLCYHPSLSPFGACRLCSVEITDKRGRKKIVTSCNYFVEEGLVVSTKSEKVIKTRKMILELLLARCPNAKRIQDLAREYDIVKPELWIEDEKERCILCGLCTRVCEELIGTLAINFANRGIEREVTAPYHTFSDDCIGCGACATVCPTEAITLERNIYPTLKEDVKEIEDKFLEGERDESLGVYSDLFAAKSPVKGQDGGIVTSLLVSGMQKSLFDAAIVVQRENGYQAKAIIAEDEEAIKKGRGTKYLRVKMMSKLEEAIEKGKKRIAVVGTPCEVRAFRKIQRVLEKEKPDVEIIVLGLFCFESFDYHLLKKETQRLLGVDVDKAEKTQITKGKYIVSIDGKDYSCGVKELGNAVENGCAYCDDFVAKLADISIGSVGSADGFSTAIVRSEVGKKLLDSASAFTKGEVNKEEITKLTGFKRKNASKKFAHILEGLE